MDVPPSKKKKDEDLEEEGKTVASVNLKYDKVGPFMSLILQRLDPSELPKVTSVVTSGGGQSDDDVEVLTDGNAESGDEEFPSEKRDSSSSGSYLERSETIRDGLRLTRRSKNLYLEESGSDTDDLIRVRRSSRNNPAYRINYNERSTRDGESSHRMSKIEDISSSEPSIKVRSQKKWKKDLDGGENEQSAGRFPRKMKQRPWEDSDCSVSSDIIIRRSSRNDSAKKINYNEDSLNVSKSDLRESSSFRRRDNSAGGRSSGKDSSSRFSSDVDSDESEKKRKTKKKKHGGKKVQKNIHQDFCCVCKDGGELLCCDACIHVFHLTCVDPPLPEMPKGSWKCLACTEPLDKVDKILTWRKKGYGREFFVHFDGKSYWQCRWVPASQLQVCQPGKVLNFYKKHGRHEPPNYDEGDARRSRKNHQDPLEIRFYQFGVRPEWLRINRIINHQMEKDGNVSYLVKWQQLGYGWVTWEHENSCKEIAEEFSLEVRKYHEWLNYFCGNPGIAAKEPFVHRYVNVPPMKPISNLERKLDKQPDCIPKGMVLHDYQLDGLNWLRYSWAKGINTILGDEMGLGKTIQAIVFINSLYREGHCQGPILISAPLSTLLNWEREFEAWAPDMYIVTYNGEPETRLLIRQTELVQDSSSMTRAVKKIRAPVKFHVLLTSYQFPSMDSTFFGSIPWEMIIIDEGHRLKNDGSLLFKDLMKYKTSYKLLLTGTPLQNNLEELFNLLNFLCPDKFDDSTKFLTEFEDIAKEDQIKKLHTLLGPHMLRRMKADVLKDMPSKSELIVRVELSPMQKQYSKHILTKNFKALNAKGGRHTSMLNIMMDLRKVCNHPYLFSKASSEAPEDPDTGLYELKTMTEASGKLLMLRKMLELLKKQGHRVLIFSQMTTMLDILEEFLEGLHYLYERIDGNVLGSERQDAIDRFNAEGAEQFVFLLSTKAGGLGINLATADTVIVYDSDWNPHNDIQAFARAHRIGQKNKVMIYRFVTRRSVEEKIVETCKKKMMLTHLVVRPQVGKSGFSKNELEHIIRFGTEELFKDQEANAPIYYTDAAIESILDRTKEEVKESSASINDLFEGFKVANCEVQEESIPDQEEAKDPDQWKYLLRQEIKKKEDEKNDLTNYGKGKRKRVEVKYNEGREDTAAYKDFKARAKMQAQHMNRFLPIQFHAYQVGNEGNQMQSNVRFGTGMPLMQANARFGNSQSQIQPNRFPTFVNRAMHPVVRYNNPATLTKPNILQGSHPTPFPTLPKYFGQPTSSTDYMIPTYSRPELALGDPRREMQPRVNNTTPLQSRSNIIATNRFPGLQIRPNVRLGNPAFQTEPQLNNFSRPTHTQPANSSPSETIPVPVSLNFRAEHERRKLQPATNSVRKALEIMEMLQKRQCTESSSSTETDSSSTETDDSEDEEVLIIKDIKAKINTAVHSVTMSPTKKSGISVPENSFEGTSQRLIETSRGDEQRNVRRNNSRKEVICIDLD